MPLADVTGVKLDYMIQFRVDQSVADWLVDIVTREGLKSVNVAARAVLYAKYNGLDTLQNKATALVEKDKEIADLASMVFALTAVKNIVAACGNNINQIAKNLNLVAAGADDIVTPTSDEIALALAEIKVLQNEISPILKGVTSALHNQTVVKQMLGGKT